WTPRQTAASIQAMLIALVFVIPTSSGRTAIVTPMVEGLMKKLDVSPGSAFGRVIFLSIPFVSIVSSTAVLTGAAVAMYSADLFQDATGQSISWTLWAMAMFPVAIVSGLAVIPVLWLVFRPAPQF